MYWFTRLVVDPEVRETQPTHLPISIYPVTEPCALHNQGAGRLQPPMASYLPVDHHFRASPFIGVDVCRADRHARHARGRKFPLDLNFSDRSHGPSAYISGDTISLALEPAPWIYCAPGYVYPGPGLSATIPSPPALYLIHDIVHRH